MIPVYLIGGGWQASAFAHTYGPFLHASARNGDRRMAIVVAEERGVDLPSRFAQSRGVFEALGMSPDDAYSVFVSRTKPLTTDDLAAHGATGVFVCGGLTSAYYDGLCRDRGWLQYLLDAHVPYAGFSAGAGIAAGAAILGGWQIDVGGRTVAIGNEQTGEELDLITVQPGLGLVPFTVDAHASQWGTLTRVLHSVDRGFVGSGWAIDEDTMLAVDGQHTHVHGLGNAYFVQRTDSGELRVSISRAVSEG